MVTNLGAKSWAQMDRHDGQQGTAKKKPKFEDKGSEDLIINVMIINVNI